MIEDTGVKEAGARVVEATLIACLGKIADVLVGHYHERRKERKALVEQVAALQAEVAALKASKGAP